MEGADWKEARDTCQPPAQGWNPGLSCGICSGCHCLDGGLLSASHLDGLLILPFLSAARPVLECNAQGQAEGVGGGGRRVSAAGGGGGVEGLYGQRRGEVDEVKTASMECAGWPRTVHDVKTLQWSRHRLTRRQGGPGGQRATLPKTRAVSGKCTAPCCSRLHCKLSVDRRGGRRGERRR